jgi:SCP-2 sterol transfer family
VPLDSARAFFEALTARNHEPRLADAVGTWEFNIDGSGTWTVGVDHGALSVIDGVPSQPAEGTTEPKTRLRMREDELLRLVRGDGHENLFLGVIRGAIMVEGELAFAQRLQVLLPWTDEGSARR